MQKLLFSKFEYSIFLWIAISLSGCNTTKGVFVEDIRKPIAVIHKAVEYAMPGGIRKRSRNNRVFYGHYHSPGKNPKINARRKLTRAHAVVKILGDRRPYRVQVLYLIEKYKNDDYSVVEDRKKLAEGVKRKL